MDVVYGIMAAIGLSIVIMFFQSRKKKKSWTGSVKKIVVKQANHMNKDPEFTSTNDFTNQAYIHYQTDNGKKGKIHITEKQLNQMYPNLKAGDKLIKKAGADFPEMVSSTTPQG